MSVKTVRENRPLQNADIAEVMERIEAWLEEHNVEKQNKLHMSLSLEEILLRWQDRFGTQTVFGIVMGSRFGQLYISLSLVGEQCDPLQSPEIEVDWSQRLLADLGLAPTFSYRRGVNTVYLKLKRQKASPLVKILIAAAAAIALGVIGLSAFPDLAATISALFLQPVRQTLLGLLAAVAVPMIFLSVMLGVCGVGDTSTFGKIGNRMLSRFLGKSILYAIIAECIAVPLFALNMSGARMDITQFGDAVQIITGILPGNLFEPFTTGNTLQVIVIAVAVGLAVLILGNRADTVKNFAEEANSIIYLLLEWVSALIPFIVFFLLLETVWAGNLGALVSIWKPLLLALSFAVLLPLLEILFLAHRFKVSPVKLFKKISPAIVITLATGSTTAAYSTIVNCCENRLGIDRKITGFGIPLGSIAYMPTIAIYFLMCVFCGAEQFATPCSAVWLVIACISSTLLALAAPPVPGGSIACFGVLFAQMGIAPEAIVFALTMDTIMDRFNATSCVALLHLELLTLSDKLDLLDRETLYADA